MPSVHASSRCAHHCVMSNPIPTSDPRFYHIPAPQHRTSLDSPMTLAYGIQRMLQRFQKDLAHPHSWWTPSLGKAGHAALKPSLPASDLGFNPHHPQPQGGFRYKSPPSTPPCTSCVLSTHNTPLPSTFLRVLDADLSCRTGPAPRPQAAGWRVRRRCG